MKIKYEKNDIKVSKINHRDTFDLFTLLAQINYKTLKAFKKHNTGYPSELTSEGWDEILDDMIKAFKLILEDKNDYSVENQEAIEHGLNLFSKYFMHLWR